MVFLKEEKRKEQSIPDNLKNSWQVPPRKKKKIFIGFDRARTRRFGLKDPILVSHLQRRRLRSPSRQSPQENQAHLHETIDSVLEKRENQHFYEIISEFEKIPVKGQDQQKKWNHTTGEESVVWQDEEEELRNEIEIRNRLLDDLEHQILERQTQLVQKTELIMRLQQELEKKDQACTSMKNSIAEKTDDVKRLHQEISNKDTLIQDIKSQLMEKQQWIVENNHFTEQLSKELEHSNRLARKIQEELQHRNMEFSDSVKDLEEKSAEILELHQEVSSRNSIIETLEKQMEGQQLQRIELTEMVSVLKKDIREKNEELIKQKQLMEQKQEELDWLGCEVESRNQIIGDLTRQLTENQTSLIEHSNIVEQLQEELLHKRKQLQETQRNLSLKDEELHRQGLQLQETQVDLDMIRGEIDSRSRIIENIEGQLAAEQMNLIEKTQLAEHLQMNLEKNHQELQIKEKECSHLTNEIKNKTHEISEMKNDLLKHLADLKAQTDALQQKEQRIGELETNLQRVSCNLKERNAQLLASKREIQELETELNIVTQDSEKRWADSLLSTIELKDKKEQVTELSLKLEQKDTLISTTHMELEKKTMEFMTQTQDLHDQLESLNRDIVARSQLIADLEHQLSDRQMIGLEKTRLAETLQGELKKRDDQLKDHVNELKFAQETLDSLQSEIATKNQIIDQIGKQLMENQTTVLQKATQVERLFDDLRGKENELLKTNQELLLQREGLEQKDLEIQSLKNVLEGKDRELQTACSALDMKQGTITSLQKQIEKSNQDVAMHLQEVHQLRQEQEQSALENDRIKKVLKARVDQLDGNCDTISKLQDEAQHQEIRFLSLVKEFDSVKHDLSLKTREIERLQSAVKTSHPDAEHFTIQLSSRGMEGELRTKEMMSFFEDLKKNQGTIKREQVEWLESLLNKKINAPVVQKEESSEIPAEKKSLAGDLDHIMKTNQDHAAPVQQPMTWKEELRICNEIEKCLDHTTEDHLKTKKLKDEEPK